MARISRAEFLTQNNFELEYYSDFATNFAKTPYGDQLVKMKNEKSIHQALKNLIMTNFGERPFQPNMGANVIDMFFENNNGDEDYHTLEFYIETAIRNYEPRVNLISVQVQGTDQSDNGIDVTITYNTINNPNPIEFNFILRRVR